MLNTGGSQSVCPYSAEAGSIYIFTKIAIFPLLFNEWSTSSYVFYYDVSHCIIICFVKRGINCIEL